MLGDCCSAEPRSQWLVSLTLSENISWVQLLPEVVNLLRLYLTLPVTSCTADRRFSFFLFETPENFSSIYRNSKKDSIILQYCTPTVNSMLIWRKCATILFSRTKLDSQLLLCFRNKPIFCFLMLSCIDVMKINIAINQQQCWRFCISHDERFQFDNNDQHIFSTSESTKTRYRKIFWGGALLLWGGGHPSPAGPKNPFCVPTDELLRAKDDLLSEGAQNI